MSRRKQTKPQHLHSDSEGEGDGSDRKGKLAKERELQLPTSSSPVSKAHSKSPQHEEAEAGEKTTAEDAPQEQDVKVSSVSDPLKETASNSSEISRPPKKRGRPPSFSSSPQKALPSFSKSHSAIATALVLAASSRRQSSRLHPQLSAGGAFAESGGKDMSHRTCEYCGVVKPTPAALRRHLRKHTGERPFVCQVCHKAYKAKRSLHCHQITNHPELLDGTASIPVGSSDSDLAASSATVSPSTSNLLRETLATRRMARQSDGHDFSAVPEFVQALAAKDVNGHNGETAETTDPPDATETPSPKADQQSKSPCFTDTTQDLSINVSTLSTSCEDADLEGEETGGDLSRRSCPQCHKVFIKPSDLKRHMMVHTGERPFVCMFCNKGFKQPGSLNYHLKATHNLDIPLSQGLEVRYQRLKTRSAMRNLVAMDSWNPRFEQDGSSVLSHYGSELPSASYADSDARPEPADTKRDIPHQLPPPVPRPITSCSSYSQDFRQGLTRQTSLASEASWSEDHGQGPNIVDVELPQFGPPEGGSEEAVHLSPRKIQMAVKKETMLFSQLDGVCFGSGQEMQVFRCHLCDKVCASMFHAFTHLAVHFQSKYTGLECRVCSLAFKSQPEMVEHFQQKHSVALNDLDLQNNNHNFTSLNAKNGEERMAEREAQDSARKSAEHHDDHNNNDIHINKEYASARSSKDDSSVHAPQSATMEDLADARPSSPKLHRNPEDSCMESADGPEPSDCMLYPSKGPHRCPKCSKCYMTKFLLDRHVAFHTRQSLIEEAMKSGAKVNGVHKDLLLQPPPVLPQDSEKYLKLKELSVSQNLEQKQEHKVQEEKQVDEEVENYLGDEPSLKKDGLNEEESNSPVLDTKAMLEKEGIQEDVTVVMPSDPDQDEGIILQPETEALSDSRDTEMAESEIRSLPKRQLIPYKKDAVPAKSRRKSSLPTRFRSILRHENSSVQEDPLSSAQRSSEQLQGSTVLSHSEQQDQSSASQSCSNSPNRLSESPQERSSESPAENDQINREFQREMLRAQQQQSSYFQNLHTAFGNMPSGLLGNPFPGNGFPPSSTLAMAAAGYLRPFPPLPGRSPFGLHGSSSVSNPSTLSKIPSSSPVSHHSGTEEEQAEDLSLSSGSITSPSTSMSTSLPSTSALPSDPEKLVGYPRVLWDASLRSRYMDGSPSPPPISTSSAANGKHLNPIWHTLSSEDLSNASATDGRKVTSLSRTHSRLYVVNQPVDRERICKPTVLPDGRTVFRCIFCHKDFLSYSDINRHMDFHEDIRPYKCNFCDYYARTNSQLKVHMMRHQGIREYCCRLCNYKGVTQSDLNRHMKSQIHLLKSRNECTKCGEGFVTTKNLEKHLAAGCDGTHKMDIRESV